MITLASDINVYLYNTHIDMRKSINGLVLLVVDSMHLDPQSKSLFLFHNKTNDKIKGILWHFDGFILLYKRKEKGRFKFPKDLSGTHYQIDSDLLQWLLKGFDFYALKAHPELKSSEYF
jgi:transposase